MNIIEIAKREKLPPALVRNLLKFVFESDDPISGLELMLSSGLMQRVLPEVVELSGERAVQDPEFHPEGNVWIHSKIVMSGLFASKDWILILAGLLHDIAKPVSMIHSKLDGRVRNPEHAEIGAEMARAIMLRLEFDERDINRVYNLVLNHMRMHKVDLMRPGKLVELLKRPDIHDLIALQHADSMPAIHPQKSRKAFLEAKLAEMNGDKPKAKKPLVDGALLISLGFRPGSGLRQIKDEGAAAESRGDFNNEQGARAWVIANFPVK